jgi:hypothetical protein
MYFSFLNAGFVHFENSPPLNNGHLQITDEISDTESVCYSEVSL